MKFKPEFWSSQNFIACKWKHFTTTTTTTIIIIVVIIIIQRTYIISTDFVYMKLYQHNL
jgi:hypothetical protein